MRLQTYITENQKGEDVEKFWELAKKKCKPFLKDWMPLIRPRIYSYNFMYRGMDTGKTFGEKKVRQDRKPESSTREFHYDVDNLMKQKHGINGRTQTVFVSGDDLQASTYGITYIIFPVGKYRFLWSHKIRDLWVDVIKWGYTRDIQRSVNTELRLRKDLEDNDEVRGELEDMFYQRNKDAIRKAVSLYKKTDLKAAIDSNTEIMIECSSYLYLKSNWEPKLQMVIEKDI